MSEHHETSLAAAFVLGSLDPGEREAFAVHLSGCAECQQEVRSLQRVTVALAASAPARTPAPGLRERVLAHAAGRPQPAARAGQVVVARRRVEARTWLPLAALLALTLGLGAYTQTLRSRVALLETGLQAALLDSERAKTATTDAVRVAERAQETIDVLVAADVARIDLAGQPNTAPMARARAYMSPGQGVVFTATGLPPLPEGRVYQLWFVTDPKMPVSAGLLMLDESGSGTTLFEIPPEVTEPVTMAVTDEPAGGRSTPMGNFYLIGQPVRQ